MKPIPGGVYAVNDAMLDDMLHAMRTHACNLGCLIAHELAAMLPGCPSFIADPAWWTNWTMWHASPVRL